MAIALAGLAGAALGALAVAVRWGMRRVDTQLGALAAVAIGAVLAVAAATPATATHGLDLGALWPFLVAGLIAPGASQIYLTLAVRHAGPSRAAILMGTAPLISILIALSVLEEPFRPLLVCGAALIVLGGATLARERARPQHFRARGAALALLCALLFGMRDNLVRWGARDSHPPALQAAASSLVAAAILLLAHGLILRRARLWQDLRHAVPAFAPAGLALASGYGALLAAFDRGDVSIVSPLSATGSLWAVLLGALLLRGSEAVGRRTVVSALLVVAGASLIGVAR
jgi:drug/metabolite transporter (DMT)-like permease